MAEVWAAAAITVVGGVMAGKAAEEKDKGDKAFQKAMTKEESALAAQRSGYEMALGDFYTQKERKRKERGLDQYRQFSTMQTVAPGYDSSQEARIELGVAPQYGDFEANIATNSTAPKGALSQIALPTPTAEKNPAGGS